MRGARAVQGCLGRGSEAGPEQQHCKEVISEVQARPSQTDTSAAGGGHYSLTAHLCTGNEAGEPRR